MKKINLLFVCTFFVLGAYAQTQEVVNINPDSKGTPWLVGGYTPSLESELLSLDQVKTIREQIRSTSTNSKKLQRVANVLPSRIDNSEQPYMRPIFTQAGGSCGSASRISYMFAYEINCYRGLPGNLYRNMYPSHFTWLLTGQNSSKEHMAMDNGVPNAVTYGGSLDSQIFGGGNVYWPDLASAPDYGWMQGYNRWFEAMNNRIEKNLSFHLNSVEALNLLKEWFLNHWGDSDFPAGGIAGTGCASTGAEYIKATNGEWILKKWGPTVDHGVTWVGYDDNIAYDYNGDGRITNDEDTNGDGIVNFKDWERGALIMRNSWGDWMNGGNVYVPYRVMDAHNAELYFVRKEYIPRRTMKIAMNYDARSELKISVGIAKNLDAIAPEKSMECEHFRYAGNGKVPMLGKWIDGNMHTEDMEFGYDITDLTNGFDATTPLKYFLKIETKSDAKGIGTVTSMSVINYDNQIKPIETVSEQTNITIKNGGAVTYVSVVMDSGSKIPSKYMSSKNWKVIDFDSEDQADQALAKHAIDGNPNTIWHTKWSGGATPYPHHITVDMGEEVLVSQFEYLPRQGTVDNGTIASYELYLTNDINNWGDPVSTGQWAENQSAKIVSFSEQKARYFKLVAKSEIKSRAWASAAELRFIQGLPPIHIPSEDWEVIDFDSESTADGDVATNAIDGNPLTKWHTKWSGGNDSYPHHITVDMKREHMVSIFEYLPRQDQEKQAENNGSVAQYELYLSNDPHSWGEPVATGTWEDNYDVKSATFKETKARYFKFVALSEVKGRAWTSAAELRFRNNTTSLLSQEPSITTQFDNTDYIKIWYYKNQIQFTPAAYHGKLEVVNMQGQIILSENITIGQNTIAAPLNSGVYIIKASLSNGYTTANKIVVQR